MVRRLEKAFTLPATAGAEKSGEVVLGIDKRWKTDDLGVAAFLQDPATLAIVGAAAREVGTLELLGADLVGLAGTCRSLGS